MSSDEKTPTTPLPLTPVFHDGEHKAISELDHPHGAEDSAHATRAAVIWGAVIAGLVVLVLLIIFFIQNQDMIAVRFFGWEGRLAQGVAFFIAAVGGGILVSIAGGARILQLRGNERRLRRRTRP